MREEKSFNHYKDCFEKGNSDLSAAEILFKNKNLETASFHIKEAVERYLAGYIYYKGWKSGQIRGINDLVNETMVCNNVFGELHFLCEAMKEFYPESEYPVLTVSKLNKEKLEKVINKTKELAKLIMMEMEKGDTGKGEWFKNIYP